MGKGSSLEIYRHMGYLVVVMIMSGMGTEKSGVAQLKQCNVYILKESCSTQKMV